MSFWETFADACNLANETLGEPVIVDGVEVLGTVSGIMSVEDGVAPGGRRWLPSCEVIVPGTVTPSDGLAVTVRGVEARVESWEALGAAEGACWLLRLGPVNRWSGEIPGA